MTDRKEQFTPGPWRAHRMRVYLPDRQNPLNVSFTEHTVDNARANAALIAAAPEMYELLDFLRNDGEICENYALAIDYVLQKARGEE